MCVKISFQAISMTDAKGRSALHYAATLGDAGVLYKALIAFGGDPNSKDSKGNTPGIYLRRKDLLTHAELMGESMSPRGRKSTGGSRKKSIDTWRRPATPAPAPGSGHLNLAHKLSPPAEDDGKNGKKRMKILIFMRFGRNFSKK